MKYYEFMDLILVLKPFSTLVVLTLHKDKEDKYKIQELASHNTKNYIPSPYIDGFILINNKTIVCNFKYKYIG